MGPDRLDYQVWKKYSPLNLKKPRRNQNTKKIENQQENWIKKKVKTGDTLDFIE